METIMKNTICIFLLLGVVPLIFFNCDKIPFPQTEAVELESVQLAIETIELIGIDGETPRFTYNNPLVVNLNLKGEPTPLGNFDIPAGSYGKIEIKVNKLPSFSDPTFTRFSILVHGFVSEGFERVPFTFAGDISSILTQDFNEPMSFIEGSYDLESRVALLVNPSDWFKDKEKNFLDPRHPLNYLIITNNIKSSIREGKATAGQLFKRASAVFPNESRIAALAVHEDGSKITLFTDDSTHISGAIFITPDSKTFTVFLGNDGLPATAFAGEQIFVFGNYNENSFDVVVIRPDGTTEVVRSISVDPEHLEFLRTFGSANVQTARLGKLAIFALEPWKQIKLASLAISVASCGLAALSGVVPAAILACSAAIVNGYTSLIAELNPALEHSSSGISLIVSAIDCGAGLIFDPLGCVSFLVELTGEELRLVENLRGQSANKIQEIKKQLITGHIKFSFGGVTDFASLPAGHFLITGWGLRNISSVPITFGKNGFVVIQAFEQGNAPIQDFTFYRSPNDYEGITIPPGEVLGFPDGIGNAYKFQVIPGTPEGIEGTFFIRFAIAKTPNEPLATVPGVTIPVKVVVSSQTRLSGNDYFSSIGGAAR